MRKQRLVLMSGAWQEIRSPSVARPLKENSAALPQAPAFASDQAYFLVAPSVIATTGRIRDWEERLMQPCSELNIAFLSPAP
jgi:hypothetical protein